VRVSPDALVQLVGNLLDNVRRHAPAASAAITATEEGGEVHVCVVDTGPGIPRARRAEVFGLGRSLDPGTAGTGVGLASARQLAEGQGGRLHLLDVPQGCGFRLTLPSAQAPQVLPPLQALRAGEA
jgi:two-component system sensor histidine kinase KdpD